MTAKAKIIVLGVTGSIAAYKAAELVRRMQQQGWDVWVMMTEAAAKYVGPLTFQALTKHPVAVGKCEAVESSTYQHLDLSGRAGVVVIAPCTANVLAKIAHGLADDVVTATVLAAAGPVLVAPAMNSRMWQNPATQANVKTLKDRGVLVLDVGEGELACGEVGAGRLTELENIVAAVAQTMQKGC
jgi:phosphopantothenoylcysteine decarboxylase/phosphopantothenate--cysteine ligase